jgi:hypothetical protein
MLRWNPGGKSGRPGLLSDARRDQMWVMNFVTR